MQTTHQSAIETYRYMVPASMIIVERIRAKIPVTKCWNQTRSLWLPPQRKMLLNRRKMCLPSATLLAIAWSPWIWMVPYFNAITKWLIFKQIIFENCMHEAL